MHWILFDLFNIPITDNLEFVMVGSILVVLVVLFLGWLLIFLFATIFNPKQHTLFDRSLQIRFWWANIFLFIAFLLSLEIGVGWFVTEWFLKLITTIPLWIGLLFSLIFARVIVSPYKKNIRECSRFKTEVDNTKVKYAEIEGR